MTSLNNWSNLLNYVYFIFVKLQMMLSTKNQLETTSSLSLTKVRLNTSDSQNFTLSGRHRGNGMLYIDYLHDSLGIPENGIGMEVFCWVKPETKLLLSVTFPLSEDVCVERIRLTGGVAQEFKIYLIMCRS